MLTDDWDYVQNAVSGFGALPKAIQSYIEIRVNTKYIHVVFKFFYVTKNLLYYCVDRIQKKIRTFSWHYVLCMFLLSTVIKTTVFHAWNNISNQQEHIFSL